MPLPRLCERAAPAASTSSRLRAHSAQRDVWKEADSRIRALEIRGSMARGAADEYSDLDTRVWIADDEYDAALADLPSLARSVGKTLDILFETPGSSFLFVQFADGVQLELSTRRVSQAKGRIPGEVVLLDRDGLLQHPYEPAPPWDMSLW
jgi:predicted nucleotidyltransferase